MVITRSSKQKKNRENNYWIIMARNHEEDQKSELEALESIYYNELESEL